MRAALMSYRGSLAPTSMTMPPGVIGVTVAQHAPAPMVPVTPAAASCDVHADARSAITVTIAPAVAALADVDAGTHAHVRPAAEVGSSTNDRTSAAAAPDDSILTAAAAALDGRAAASAAALDGRTAAATTLDTGTAALTFAAAGVRWRPTASPALLRQHDAGIVAGTRRRGGRSRFRRRQGGQCQSQQARAGEI